MAKLLLNKKNIFLAACIAIICVVAGIKWDCVRYLICIIIDWFGKLSFWEGVAASIVAAFLFIIICTSLSVLSKIIFGDFFSRLKDRFFSRIAAEVKMEVTMPKDFTDERNNKKYRVVKIGGQIWMAENLDYEITTDSSRCVKGKYGRLYNWETAMKVCPKGWHLPSDDEWKRLVNFVGGVKAAGKNLKATSDWNNNNGTDEFGFSAMPDGNCDASGKLGGGGEFGSWWTSTEYNQKNAYNWHLERRGFIYKDLFKTGYYDKSMLFSVRCVKDSDKYTLETT